MILNFAINLDLDVSPLKDQIKRQFISRNNFLSLQNKVLFAGSFCSLRPKMSRKVENI